MTIEYTITLGALIQIVVMILGGIVTIGGGLWALGKFHSNVEKLARDVIDVKTELKEVAKILTKLAVTDTRLTAAEQDIRDLQHGRGYVQNRSEGGINGEYP